MRHPIVLGYDGSACSSAALDPGCAAAKELRDCKRRVETEVEPMRQHATRLARRRRRLARPGPIAGALGGHTRFDLLHHSDLPVLVAPHRH